MDKLNLAEVVVSLEAIPVELLDIAAMERNILFYISLPPSTYPS